MFVIATIWAGFFLVNINVAIMIPLLPFMQREMALTSFESGAVLASFPIVALIANLLLGPFIDRYGRRPFMAAGAAVCAVLLLATALAETAAAAIACRAATGLFMPMVGASLFAAIADNFPVEERTRVTGYVTSAAPVALLLALSLGVISGGLLDWRVPLAALAAFAMLLALASMRLPPTPPALRTRMPIRPAVYRQRLLSFSVDRDIRLVLLCYLLYSAAIFVFLGLYPAWMIANGGSGNPAGAGAVGSLLFLGGLFGVAGALAAGRVATFFRHPLALCAVAAVGTAAAMLAAPLLGRAFTGQTLTYAGFAFGRDLMLALMLGGAMMLVSPTERASLNAMLNAVYQLGGAFGGMASAWLFAMSPGYGANAVVAAALLLATGLMLHRIAGRAAER